MNKASLHSLNWLRCRVFLCICLMLATTVTAGCEQPLELTRDQVILNGNWRFSPAKGDAPPKTGWGSIRVPGAWHNKAWWVQPPGVQRTGEGKGWDDLKNLERAWYQREIEIPSAWAGRTIELAFDRVSTDAVVYLDGKKVGSVAWPEGNVDLTDHAKPGAKHQLSILVLASTDRDQITNFMGTATEGATREKAELSSRGLIGDVTLTSRPPGGHISDVFVQTSVEKSRLSVQLELSDVTQAAKAQLIVKVLDADRDVEESFEKSIELSAKPRESIAASWEWKPEELWDFKQPHLYTLQVAVQSEQVHDAREVRFGFREFRIQGRDFFLNGTKIRLRPVLMEASGMKEVDASRIDSALKAGFNFVELWPNDHFRRGYIHYRELFAETADEKGMLVAGSLGYMNEFISSEGEFIWSEPEGKAAFRKRVAQDIRRWRNHPSIVMWASSGNYFGHSLDQDPRHIGRKGWVPKDEEAWHERAKAGTEGADLIKELDPTRPLFTHHGAYVGDVHTANMYLNFIPLQEREEWLSEYAKEGQMPFSAVEFGAPLSLSTRRDRDDHDGVSTSEPLATEWSAVYFGPRAYEMENGEYRSTLAEAFDKESKRWPYLKPATEQNPAVQKLLALFIKNTWRSWRTWGLSGGMIPWMDGHGWENAHFSHEKVKMPAFEPGRRGLYLKEVEKGKLEPYFGKGRATTEAGQALVQVNGPSLAWIAGPSDRFTAKDHSFRGGEPLTKQLVLINDSRTVLDYSAELMSTLGMEELGFEEFQGKLQVGEIRKLPIKLKLPEVEEKQDGKLEVRAKIGETEHTDTFYFRVFPDPKPVQATVYIADPLGETRAMLQAVGAKVHEWDGKAQDHPIIVGRKALSDGKLELAKLQPLVQQGARVLIMGQDPEWTTRNTGFRRSRHIARRTFPIHEDHPLTRGLDADDLSNWSGESQLIEPRPKYEPGKYERGTHAYPYAGWRWGGYGGVSTGAIEKPHRSGWRPLIECEFDLAYTPVMELDYGKGRVIWSQLDLEDHHDSDPAAGLLARNLVHYLAQTQPQQRADEVLYLGNDTGRKLLDLLGVQYRTAGGALPAKALVILGPGAQLSDDDLKAHLTAGGRALVLPRREETMPLGVTLKKRYFNGSLTPPSEWPEAAGLSASDLRMRANHQVFVLEQNPKAAEQVELAADGLLARKRIGTGVLVYAQVDPTLLPADELVYFRYTRWRQMRVLSQLLANLGASFEADGHIFRHENPNDKRVPLAGSWKARVTLALPSSLTSAHDDPGISEDALRLVAANADDSGLRAVEVPGDIENVDPSRPGVDGEAVFRKVFQLPAGLAAQDLELSLGPVDDFDRTYVNGKLVGSVDKRTPQFWSKSRVYRIPHGLLKPGRNVVAVRVFDHMGRGGFKGQPSDLAVRIAGTEANPENPLYHPDYISDFVTGDDPYRYARW